MKELLFGMEVLKAVPQLKGSLFIYGGCIRDTMTGKPIKDIDIAYPWEEAPIIREALIKSKLFVNPKTLPEYDLDVADDAYENRDPAFVASYELVPKNESMPVVNFIGLDEKPFEGPYGMEFVANRCDLGFCQASMDLDGMYMSVNYKRDIHLQTITLCDIKKTAEEYSPSLKRVTRLRKKYKDWQPVAPANLMKMLKLKKRGFQELKP
jgi:hypothetical protein